MTGSYSTQIQCEVCHEYFEIVFDDPTESFAGTCPICDTHYPEVWV